MVRQCTFILYTYVFWGSVLYAVQNTIFFILNRYGWGTFRNHLNLNPPPLSSSPVYPSLSSHTGRRRRSAPAPAPWASRVTARRPRRRSPRPAALEGPTVLEFTGADRMGLLSEIFAVLADIEWRVMEACALTHRGRLACVVFLHSEDPNVGRVAWILARLGAGHGGRRARRGNCARRPPPPLAHGRGPGGWCTAKN